VDRRTAGGSTIAAIAAVNPNAADDRKRKLYYLFEEKH